MRTEIGLDVTCAIVILLHGAIIQIEHKALGRGLDDMEKQRWRDRLFGHSYWVTPFGSLTNVKAGLTLRIEDLGGVGLVPELERFIGWMEKLEGKRPAVRLEDCTRIREMIFQPALSACERMSNGNLP